MFNSNIQKVEKLSKIHPAPMVKKIQQSEIDRYHATERRWKVRHQCKWEAVGKVKMYRKANQRSN